jgi:N-acyl-L-homoserine lactone synthetase
MLVVAEEDGAVTGAAAVQFFNRPTSRIAFVSAFGGKGVTSEIVFAQLKDICRHYGATHIEGAVRESVARMLQRIGWAEKYRIVGVAL